MTAKGGEALELAMVLLRAPALRSALRVRPLPEGVGEVLAIASGSPATLRRAAERSRHGEAELLEASRFFVQQVLLAEGADAYRVLGADRHADRETLRDHHLLLQRWLHPDRSDEGEQWDSALATRVNRAWQQLRTASARAAYDATLPPEEPAAATTPAGASGPVGAPMPVAAAIAAIHPAPPAPPRPIAAPVFVGLLAIACLVLTWLALTREPRFEDASAAALPAAPLAAPAARQAPPAAPELAPGIAVLQPGVEAVLSAAGPGQDPRPGRQAGPRAPAPPPDAPAPEEPQTRPRPQPDESFDLAAAPPAAPALAWADQAPPAREWPAAAPLPASAAEVPLASATATALAFEPTPTAAPEPMLPPAPVPAPAPLQPTALASAPVPAQAQSQAPADPLQLFQEAEAALRGVTDWLASPGGAEPAWLGAATGSLAAEARGSLHGRHPGTPVPRLELQYPNWTLDGQAATVIGAYRLGERGRTVETGTLRMELARRQGRWRVAVLQLEPAR